MSQGTFEWTTDSQPVCFGAARERRRARLLAGMPSPAAATRTIEPRRSLTARDIEHRRRMLTHLDGLTRRTR